MYCCIGLKIYIYTYTHTHIYIYIYIKNLLFNCIYLTNTIILITYILRTQTHRHRLNKIFDIIYTEAWVSVYFTSCISLLLFSKLSKMVELRFPFWFSSQFRTNSRYAISTIKGFRILYIKYYMDIIAFSYTAQPQCCTLLSVLDYFELVNQWTQGFLFQSRVCRVTSCQERISC